MKWWVKDTSQHVAFIFKYSLESTMTESQPEFAVILILIFISSSWNMSFVFLTSYKNYIVKPERQCMCLILAMVVANVIHPWRAILPWVLSAIIFEGRVRSDTWALQKVTPPKKKKQNCTESVIKVQTEYSTLLK